MKTLLSATVLGKWPVPLPLPEALGNEVWAWLAALQVVEWAPPARELLSSDERTRADRFAFESDRHRFILSHAALRCMLGQVLGCDPAQLRFESTVGGKPVLASHRASDLHFNLSHSGDLALIAVARKRPVGADLERIQDQPALLHSVGGFLAPGEQACLERLTPAEAGQTFYQIWTRKEAVLKAAGQGITAGLNAPDLSADLAPSSSGPVSRVEHQGIVWLVYGFLPAPGYQGALAVASNSH